MDLYTTENIKTHNKKNNISNLDYSYIKSIAKANFIEKM